jgi:hypothetical protein
MTFYGTSAAGAAWIVPKKYVEKVGDDGSLKAPVGAGPYRVVSFTPGVELVMEAFEGSWRKVPSVKLMVFRGMADESTRAAALKAGDVHIVHLLSGPTATDVKADSGAPWSCSPIVDLGVARRCPAVVKSDRNAAARLRGRHAVRPGPSPWIGRRRPANRSPPTLPPTSALDRSVRSPGVSAEVCWRTASREVETRPRRRLRGSRHLSCC